jgi:hypothetical protein
MQPHLKTAYILGAITARKNFEKEAAHGDIATPIAGAFGPLPAALAGGLTAPEGHGMGGAGGAALGNLLGGVGGGLGGAALGGAGGYGVGHLAKALGAKDIDPGTLAALGAILGGGAGGLGGGMYGAYKGRRMGIGEEHLSHHEKR